MLIEHISISRGKSYKNCPYYYKLKYHEKIPNPGEEQFYFTYGKIVHKIAEVHVQERGKRPIGAVCDDVLKGRIEIDDGKKAPPLPPDYRRRLPVNIANLDKLNKSIGCHGVTEHKFRYDLSPPSGKLATGFIDRIILDGEKAWIIDYKTTKQGPFRENKETIKYDPQLRMYCRVVQKEFGLKAENIKAALYYLEDGLVLSSSYDEESLTGIESELLELYNEISERSADHVAGRTGPHCNRCEYKEMCPFFKNKSKVNNWNGDLKSL
jgi:CRISPR/Cas system-associated exonuclease Cas4 (RecB family)